MTYDNIKSHKKPGFQTLFRRYIFRKTTGRGQIDPPTILGLRHPKIKKMNTMNILINSDTTGENTHVINLKAEIDKIF